MSYTVLTGMPARFFMYRAIYLKGKVQIMHYVPTQRIRLLRELNNLTQREVAERLGISSRCYSHYEKGTRSLPVDVLEELSEFYHVSTDYLLERTDEEEPPFISLIR